MLRGKEAHFGCYRENHLQRCGVRGGIALDLTYKLRGNVKIRGQNILGRANKCKGPEAGPGLACWNNRKDSEAGA